MTDKDKTALGKWYDSLKELENGQAWVWHPEAPEIYKKIHFRERETFHATRENLKTPEAGKIRLMDVGEFLDKFKAVFEPKPMAKDVPKPVMLFQEPVRDVRPLQKAELKPVQEPILRGTFTSPALPPVQEPNGNTQVVQQALPTIRVEQYKPTLTLPVELLDQPSTPMGRVAVVLKNDTNNPGKWSLKRIVKDIQDHGWDAADTQQVIDQFLRWEIFTRRADNYLQFHPGRIQISERTDGLQVA
jgi:hypothetical protein